MYSKTFCILSTQRLLFFRNKANASGKKCIHNSDFFSCGAATQCGSWPPYSRGFLQGAAKNLTIFKLK